MFSVVQNQVGHKSNASQTAKHQSIIVLLFYYANYCFCSEKTYQFGNASSTWLEKQHAYLGNTCIFISN